MRILRRATATAMVALAVAAAIAALGTRVTGDDPDGTRVTMTNHSVSQSGEHVQYEPFH